MPASTATADPVQRPHGVVITLAAIAFLLLSPVLIPSGMILAAFSNRRLRGIASTFRCVQCDQVLGDHALEWASDAHRAHFADLFRRFPNSRFRIIQTCHAICTTCGTRYRFDEKQGALVLKDPGVMVTDDQGILPFLSAAMDTATLRDGSRVVLFSVGSAKRLDPLDSRASLLRYLYATGEDRNVFRIAADNQSVLWRITAPTHINPRYTDPYHTLGFEDGKLKTCTSYALEYEIDRETGVATIIQQVGIWNVKRYSRKQET